MKNTIETIPSPSMVQMVQRANMCAADRVSAERAALCAENVLDYAQALIRFTNEAAGILSAMSGRAR